MKGTTPNSTTSNTSDIPTGVNEDGHVSEFGDGDEVDEHGESGEQLRGKQSWK